MFGSVKNWIVIVAILSVISYIGYKQYESNSLKNEIRILEANSAIMTQALKDSKDALDNLNNEYNKIRVVYENTVAEFKKVDENNKYAKQVIDGVDTKSIQDVNKTYKDALRCLELASGSPFTAKEKEAKNDEEFNSMCPWLYPGNINGGLFSN